MTGLDLDTGDRGATISDDGLYRYDLWRRWGTGRLLGFVMLNPSTGDALDDDHTLRRCMYYARRDGWSGITVRNLYAYRTPYPRELTAAGWNGVDIVGPDNDAWLSQLVTDPDVGDIVGAWGTGPPSPKRVGFRERVDHVLTIFPTLHTLKPGPGSFWPHPARLHNDCPIVATGTNQETA